MKFYPKSYLDDVLVRFTYHSTGIEGNTLNLGETSSILLNQTITSNQKHSLREIYEVDNHREAIDYLLTQANAQVPVSISFMQQLHQKLTQNTVYNAGSFKDSSNYIKGADFQTAAPDQVPTLMQQWCDNLNYQLSHVDNSEQWLRSLLQAHIQFEQYHPFSDGNGRTGRLLMNFELAKQKRPWLVIERNERDEYLSYLQNNDLDGFAQYATKKLNAENQRLVSFQKQYQKQLNFQRQQLRKDNSSLKR